jgi:hypothetical protein
MQVVAFRITGKFKQLHARCAKILRVTHCLFDCCLTAGRADDGATEQWQDVAMADDVEHQQQRWVEEISIKPHVFL